MSRIHDALKRAEQDRFVPRGAGIHEMLEPPMAPAHISSPAEAGAPHANPSVTSTAGESSLASKLANCRQVTWKPDTSTMLFFDSEEKGIGNEEFRTLRSRLYQLREKRKTSKILIASAMPREGRSFVAANVAQVLARQPNCRTLLIDADLRNPALHLVLGTTFAPGLSGYLLGETKDEFSV